ncbi:MFS transporter [Ornithinimicrobium pekingense]|uniref:MFS transporter n=1 Tax=Ornithinimicrobium pekingense TaxID=384677 RepID=A0ABQ2F5I6_9MICO|nr:MFS transporter [Ornithinimicrobium pekingense]GGK63076.1 MFS transporter [Ornithinimicrobium pekingense]
MGAELRRQVHNIGRRRAWVIWLVGLSIYTLAVFHRTSLSVAGIIAAERFDITAGQLSTFTVLQLAVYAAMQIPVGVLIDRYGSKRLMFVGLSLMTAGQFWFALAGTFEAGVAARVLLGIGDAMVFTSLLRLIALWFHVKQAPMVTQLTSMVGQLGAVAAATPLAAALSRFGWGWSYGVAAGVGVVLGVALLLLVRDSPYTGEVVERIKVRALARSMAEVWGNPGTRLGLWVHFSSQFGPTVFTMLWGYPFLIAEGLTSTSASGLLIVMVVTAMAAGPVVGSLTSRMPYHRSTLVLVLVAAIATVWAVVLLWPGPAPLWLLVVMVMVTAVGGPGSMVSFDLARTFHPSERYGRANGMINIGGFVASLMTIGLIGLILDYRAPGGPSTYTSADFRVAMAVQFPFWALGAFQLWRYRNKGRALIGQHPGAMEALREGQTLLPGLSRPAAPGPRPDAAPGDEDDPQAPDAPPRTSG